MAFFNSTMKWFSKKLKNIFDANLELRKEISEGESWLEKLNELFKLRSPFTKIEDGFVEIEETEYKRRLSTEFELPQKEKAKLAFDLAVKYRQFEIELYWKRATYFWVFIASAFTAYIALVSADEKQDMPIFIVICVGFILSSAWYYTNQGSKTWQRHWEKHIDLLEDNFSGPLYKTVFETRTFSVSKINLIVSYVFRLAWIGLGIDFLLQSKRLYRGSSLSNLDWRLATVLIVTLLAWSSMKYGMGRGRFRKRSVEIFERQ